MVRFYDTAASRVIDFDITLSASDGPLTFGDTKEGMFGLRVASSMDVDRKKGGKITNAEGLTDADVSNEAIGYLDARELVVADVPALLLRIGFVGELGYELHVPSLHGEQLWDTLVAAGARPFALEAQRILRLE